MADYQQLNQVNQFVRQWFDLLSEHPPVEKLLPLVTDEGLDMQFPERSMHSHAEFRDWYEDVGKTFQDQSHTVETVTSRQTGDRLDLDVVVIFQATLRSDGTRLKDRATQQWTLTRTPGGGLAIVTYRITSLDPL